MNVSCPQCKTVFRVDPDKVPSDGVRARCSVCGGVFEVGSDEGEAQRFAPVWGSLAVSRAMEDEEDSENRSQPRNANDRS